MSYTALYRKFRPQVFEDVKGQEHIVTTLKNQVKAERVGHAYLFCGTRGTGKTTIAKLLAKAVNCEHPVDGSPCNECEMCKKINQGISLNVIEIDAASNNGVDNIRDIIEEVRYSPTEGKYKVYIIDEVHMLSAGAFNALLKTLEEPPHYVVFILATTEVHKIPITILSRCQRYDFRRITVDIISNRLRELMQIEHTEVEEKALRYIARAGDGSMRDALSLLDQCIAFYYGETLTYDKVIDVLGAVDVETFSKLLKNIQEQNVIGVLKQIEEMTILGRDLTQFTVDFTWYMRNLLLIKSTEEALEMIEVSSENYVVMKAIADQIDVAVLIRYIRIFSELSNQIKYASQKRVMIEVALIKLCKPVMERNYDSIISRLKAIEEQLENGYVASAPRMGEQAHREEEQEQEDMPIILADALPEEIRTVAEKWDMIISKIGSNRLKLAQTCLRNAIPTAGNGNQLILIFHNAVEKGILDKEETLEEVELLVSQVVGKKIHIQTKLAEDQSSRQDDMLNITKIIKNVPVEFED